MGFSVIDSLASWARAIAALPATGALPLRTVLVPDERHAHALRRELLRAGDGEVLAGTRFVSAVTLAIDVLRDASVDFEPGEDALRPARLLALFDEELPLEYFDLDLVRRGGGWNEAFAHAIETLEAAGLTPERLPTSAPQWRDLATLWRRLDTAAGTRWTASRVLREAAARLARGAKFAGGPVLAAVTGHERAVHAAFARALPDVAMVRIPATPVRDRHGRRLHALYGVAPDSAAAHGLEPARPASELEVLQRWLFSSPEALADPQRPVSGGRDGTVELEEHAGVEEEVEAAADWVAREILERRTPLERIAVLVPVHDPLAGLVAGRLARLPSESGPLPVHVAGGLPITATAGGARVLSVLRAFASWLSADVVATVLPALRAPRDERQHLTHGEAVELAWSLGTVGGTGAHPARALEWTERAALRDQELARSLAAAAAEAGGDRASWHVERVLTSLRAARPALDALVAVARLLVEGATLADLAPAVASFVRAWVLDPADGAPVTARLAEAFEDMGHTDVGARVRGPAALEVLVSVVDSLRTQVGRFGQPAVFVGSVAHAAGLEFDAVRVIGLCEGTIPPAVRQDPVLPDGMRAQADPQPLVPQSIDRILEQLHAFARVVRGTRRRLVLSAPRVNLERTEREPSSLFVEVGASLGRPHVISGERQSVIPDLPSLRRDAFGPARAASTAFRTANPVGASAWLRRAAGDACIPPPWSGDERFDLSVIEALGTPRPLSLSEGALGADASVPVLPGTTPEHPISASALATLLRCPRSFLYERVLHWSEPAGAPSLREVDQPFYGNLFHEVMERFYRANGTAFVARERTLAQWQRDAAQVADEGFAAFLSSYPLLGDGLRARELDRLRHDVRRVLQYDWDLPGKRAFVDVERAFGEEEPVAVSAGRRTLYLRGYIDRLDVEGDHTLVRDLKTGNAHPRTGVEAGIAAELDLQLAVYGIVVKQLASSWRLPKRVQAAYVYPLHRGEPERAFREDFDALEKAGREWLSLAASLLHERVFPPTTVAGDCRWCPLRPFCGTGTPRRSAEVLAGTAGTLGAFREFKAGGHDE